MLGPEWRESESSALPKARHEFRRVHLEAIQHIRNRGADHCGLVNQASHDGLRLIAIQVQQKGSRTPRFDAGGSQRAGRKMPQVGRYDDSRAGIDCGRQHVPVASTCRAPS